MAQPAAVEQTTNAAASGTVVDSPPTNAPGSSSTISASTRATPANDSCRSSGWRAIAHSGHRRRTHIPRPAGTISNAANWTTSVETGTVRSSESGSMPANSRPSTGMVTAASRHDNPVRVIDSAPEARAR